MEVTSTAVRIEHRSDVAEARRQATSIATSLDLDEAAVGRVALVTTELVTNVLKHAGGGWCYISPAEEAARAVDLLVTDKGGGIADLQQALGDGYSTAGTPGTGIGAVRRQSVAFDMFTRTGQGTVMAARTGPDPIRGTSDSAGLLVRGFASPSPGEELCGDTWIYRPVRRGAWVLVADGLGHGPQAAEASRAAARVLLERRADSPAGVVGEIHDALAATRGAAVAVALLEPARSTVRFAGIGNISARIVTSRDGRGMVSSNGTAGFVARTVREFSYEAPPGALVVMHSDGLTSRWDVGDYPGLSRRDPAVVAGVLLRDFSRGRDDASVVVARMPSERQEP